MEWIKASASGVQGNCVEVALEPVHGSVMVRDSKDPDGPVLAFTPLEWLAFLAGAKAGEFELRQMLAAHRAGQAVK